MNTTDATSSSSDLAEADIASGIWGERLTWLPYPRLGMRAALLVMMAICGATLSLVVLTTQGPTFGEILICQLPLIFVALLGIALLRMRAKEAAGSHLTLDRAAGLLRLRCVPLDFSMDVPLDTVTGIALRPGAAGSLVLVLRNDAPPIMASGPLPLAVAEAQALRLAALITRPFKRGDSRAEDAVSPLCTPMPGEPEAADLDEACPDGAVVIETSHPPAMNTVWAWVGLAGGVMGLMLAASLKAGWDTLFAIGCATPLVAWALHQWLPDTPAYHAPPRRIEIDGAARRLRVLGGSTPLPQTGWIEFNLIHSIVMQPIEDSDNLAVDLQLTDRPAIALTGGERPGQAEFIAYRIAAEAGCAVRTRQTARLEA